MRLILLLTVIGCVLIALGLLGLYVDVTRRLAKIERSMKRQNDEIKTQSRELRVIKDRATEQSDRVIITYEPKDNGIKYGGEGI